MIRYCFKGLLLLMLSASTAFAENGTMTDTVRGAMLYDNHCLECHTQQVHWRKKKMVIDWQSLITQVDRWQRASRLDWKNADIEVVSRYLNGKYYHYP
jgi:hypothetical protein